MQKKHMSNWMEKSKAKNSQDMMLIYVRALYNN